MARKEIWILIALLVAAAGVRLPGLFAGLWHDEVMYSGVYFGNPARRAWLLWRDVHPPVYPLLLWVWSSLLGNHEAVLRLPSFLLGLGSLALSWKLARRGFGPGVALLAVAVLTFSPPHIWYSVENKANMLALFLSVLAVWLGTRVAEAPARGHRWLALLAVLLLALGTHSHALAIAGAVLTWLAWRAWREPGLRWRTAGAVLVVLAAWIPLFLWKTASQGATLARGYLRALDPGEIYKLLLVWFPHGNTLRCLAPYRSLRQAVEQPWPYFFVDAACAVLLLLGLAAAVRAGFPRRGSVARAASPWPSRLLLLWLLPPLVAAALASLALRHFYIERNLLLLLPAYAILLALGCARLRWPKARALASAGLVALALAGTVSMLGPRKGQWTVYKPKPDWRGAAAWLESEGANAGRLAVATTNPSLETDFYLRPRSGHPVTTVTDYCGRGRVAPRFLASQGGGSFWLVKNETWTVCWTEALRLISEAPGVALRSQRHFAGLTLYEFAAR